VRNVHEERRRNAKALLIVLLVLMILGAFAYRPATLIGVEGDALAHSVGGGSLLGASNCVEVDDDVWRCEILDYGGSRTTEYTVETRSFGCWDAVYGRARDGAPNQESGCINAFDVVSPF
jgi:hypothetical protein